MNKIQSQPINCVLMLFRAFLAMTCLPIGGYSGSTMNDDGYKAQLELLKLEHRDLDDAIAALTAQNVIDQMQIARLKKKKLVLKDQIMRLHDQLVPDILA
jgi:hypothetical protein